MSDLLIVDLSSNQSINSYPQLNAAIDGAYIRVRRSNGARDVDFEKFHNGITKPRAPYIFLRPPSVESFTAQLKSFWSWCGDMPWEWGTVLDAEYTGLTGAQLRDAVSACRDVTQRPIVHGYVGYANLRAGGSATPSTWVTDINVRIIGARYFANNRAKAFANFGMTHPQLDIVQYWNKGTCPGISASTPVDLNSGVRLILQEDDMGFDLDSKLPPITMADGTVHKLTVADVLSGLGQFIQGNGSPAAQQTAHPQGGYNSRILSLSTIDANVAAIKGALPTNQAALLAAINSHSDGTASIQDMETAFSAVLGDGFDVAITPKTP